MKAVRIHEFGGPDKLRLEELPMPTAGVGEVLICVKAASVNPVDFKTREGKFPLVKADALPLVIGRDVSGKIHALGPGTIDASVGDDVYVNLPFDQGGYAHYTLAKASLCARKPRRLDWVEAAAVPLAACTAWQGLFTHGGLGRGQRVLIHAAAGGVGHFAVQFAKSAGARVFATASGEGVAFVKKLGADHVLDHKHQSFTDFFKHMDVVLDLVGGETRKASYTVLRRNGVLVTTLDEPDQSLASRHGVRALRFTTRQSREHLTQIARLIDEGRVTPYVEKVFPLTDYADALHHVEEGHTQGKVVLSVEAEA